MQIKAGVDLRGLHPVWGVAYPVICHCYLSLGYSVTLTSGTEGAPGRLEYSRHYKGMALDFRLKHLSEMHKLELVANVKAALGAQFDVVHKNPKTEREHLHVEFDPKELPKEDEL